MTDVGYDAFDEGDKHPLLRFRQGLHFAIIPC
jgi:hypothetical protein